MKRLDICCFIQSPTSTSTSYLVLALLQSENQTTIDALWPPITTEDSKYEGVEFVGRRWIAASEYELVPPAFFPTLQSRLFQKYHQLSSPSTIHLSRGLTIIKSQDGMNLAKLDWNPIENRLEVIVRGQSPYLLLSELVDSIERILEYYSGL